MTTITISDWNVGTYVCTTTEGHCNVTYVITENITLTN